MGSTVPFELSVGAFSALVSPVAAILLGAIRNEHVFPHENRRPLAIVAIVLTIVADVYLHFAITRIDKNGTSRMLSHRMHPLAHLAVSLMLLALSLGIVLSDPYNNDMDRFYFDGPGHFFPTGPVEMDCCLFWGLVGLHLFNFMAVIANRARRQSFKDSFGYDGYSAPRNHGNDIALETVNENGQSRRAAPKRVYVV